LSLAASDEVLRRLDLAITRRLDGLLQGDYRGLVPAHGSEPGEAREYEPGDDVRRMDWNVTARMQKAHVRDTIADRELETWVLCDLSASLDFGTAECEKRDLAVAAVAAVGFLTARTGNRIGAVVVRGDQTITVPARTGRASLLGLLHRVVTTPRGDGGGDSNLAVAIDRLNAVTGRRGLAVVVSDFIGQDDWSHAMQRLASRHDVLAIEVVDPRELELPSVGVLTLVDPETGRAREVQTASAKLRARYAAAATEQRESIAQAIRAAGADHLVLRTDRDWLGDIVRFVTLRRRRVETLRRPAR
jgi:uncharacterized protein (DUF58 family)